MFNNVGLDIAIGLVFIYLLYSLLATTINEFVAMLFAYRHRMLEKGVEQMLDGKNYSYYWWDKLINITKWIFTRKYFTKRNVQGVPKVQPPFQDFYTNQNVVADGRENIWGYKRWKLDAKAALF